MIVFDLHFIVAAGNREVASAPVVAQRGALRLRNLDHSGEACDPLAQALYKRRRAAFIVALRSKVEECPREVVHVESRIDRLGAIKSAQQESGRQQQDHAPGDLRSHQPLRKSPLFLPSSEYGLSSFKAVFKSSRELFKAGISPNITPVKTVSVSP